jgi:hypothetical protein
MTTVTGESELGWLSSVLWDNAGQAPDGGRYAVLPSRERPRLLVPLGSHRAAAAALAGYTTSRLRSRIGARALAAGFRLGVAPLLVRGRAGPPPDDRSDALFERQVERLLGRRLFLSIFFQTGRPQKKPVMQLFAADGRLLGYAKVGWNDLTRRLVRAEGEALDLLAARLPAGAPLRVAPLRHRGAWRGRELLLVDAVPGVEPVLVTALPEDVTRAVGELGEPSRMPLTRSAYWREQRSRIVATGDAEPSALAGLAEGATGRSELAFGFGHGDWVPWNMGRAPDGRLLVWDGDWWRRELPAGLDAVQWLFQTDLNLRGRRPRQAVDTTLEAAGQVLPRLGVDAGQAPALLAMHLIEAMLRLAEARSGGVGAVIPAERYRGAALRLLAVAA